VLPRSFQASDGRIYFIGSLLGAGGQGEVHEATERGTGRKMVLKLFFARYSDEETFVRTRWLVEQNLSAVSPLLKGPVAWVRMDGRVGHIAPRAPGVGLDELLEKVSWDFKEGMQLGIAIAQAVALCEQRDMAMGDIAANNVFVFRNSTLQPSLIDLDNFVYPSLPKPKMAGNKLYLAPEVADGKLPSIESDRYALMVLLSEIVLLSHPLHVVGPDEKAFATALHEGIWKQDPSGTTDKTAKGGYPPKVLSPSLHRLFRRAAGRDLAARPPAKEWVAELRRAFDQLYPCPHCRALFVVDTSKHICPLCNKPFPDYVLETPAGAIRVASGAVLVGRDALGGSGCVSRHHAVLRKIGPELWLEDISSSGTYRRLPDGSWTRLPSRTLVLLKADDLLRFGDVRVSVRQLLI
jgi:serine/threonine protein kinase